MARRYFLIGLLLAVCLLLLKPAVVKTDSCARLLVLLRWQSGAIRFINSVTEKPVTIRFRIGGLFHAFSVSTDEATEAYYTHGLYVMDAAVATEATDVLRFCSMKGIALDLGFYDFDLKDGCLEVKLLWTM
jgi:hypothetical protein